MFFFISAERSKIKLNDKPDLRAAAAARFILGILKKTRLKLSVKANNQVLNTRFIERFPQILFGSLGYFSNNTSEERV